MSSLNQKFYLKIYYRLTVERPPKKVKKKKKKKHRGINLTLVIQTQNWKASPKKRKVG